VFYSLTAPVVWFYVALDSISRFEKTGFCPKVSFLPSYSANGVALEDNDLGILFSLYGPARVWLDVNWKSHE
jgi:hypothetical protein